MRIMKSLTGQESSWEVQKQDSKKSMETPPNVETDVIDGSYTEPPSEEQKQETK